MLIIEVKNKDENSLKKVSDFHSNFPDVHFKKQTQKIVWKKNSNLFLIVFMFDQSFSLHI